jgi:general secretion pathway protein F
MTQTAPLAFDIVGVAAHGGVSVARVHAASAQQAVQRAQLDGLRVLSCRPATAPRWARPRLQRAAKLDVALLAEELAALLDAGLGMVDALRTLAQKERSAHARTTVQAVADALTEGLPLSAALARRHAQFPALLVATVAASEQTGDLVSALRRYAAHLESLRALRGKVIGAAIYPALLLAIGSLVVLFLLGVVVPRFAVLLEGAQRDLPFASSVLLAWGKAIAAHPAAFGAAAAAGFALAAAGLARALRSGWQIAGLQRVWIIGPLVQMFRHAQFFRTSAMLVRGGIPALRAFGMCRSLLAPEDRSGLDAAMQSIAAGQPIGPALHRAGIADPVALRMLEVAQRTGQLADVLARIAQFQEAQLTRSIDVASRLIEPALMILIGLVIGGIVVLMYLPIFDLASSLQ